jgi:predicted nucleic acid-binding protein
VRVFLDANVLFSASNADSNIARLVDWLFERGTGVSSDLAIEEARRNLALKRPPWLGEFERIQTSLEIVPSASFALSVALAAKDAPLLCSAIAATCEYFVTGDRRDFGHLYGRSVMGVEVISLLRLAELLAAIRSR